ncbi:amino acid adenylation domain-containing protein [Clostridium aminobutyricum]|uniref:Amino acid adenylation domain-containing protein n=1 Tax=Clostridium aminobutyricum TaxID=33953 RepID=A0A939DAY1_CLOAM|nr:amino acid adenylation domain-containing protein [Clostridium aminobutyricum]MBN7773928.1 amino acid adenylation domain-containing protein [Clostridium aminobutyricum]
MKLQKGTISREVNQTQKELPGKPLWHDFLAYSKPNSDKNALYWNENGAIGTLSYGALREYALRVTAYLAENQIGEGEIIGVSIPRSWKQIAVILGISMHGCAYAPIRYGQPLERKEKMCKTAGMKYAFIGDESIAGVTLLSIEQALESDAIKPLPKKRIDDLAYVIFTSGSTGEPKGVMITHEEAHNTLADVIERFDIGEEDIAIGVSSVDFDLSVFDIFGMLSVGGSLVLLREEESQEAGIWIELVEKLAVTVWNSVPKLWEMFLSYVSDKEQVRSLQTILLSGDWVRPQLIKETKNLLAYPLVVAMGGATEASIWSNYFIVNELEPEWTAIPYGYPLANQKMRITDEQGNDVPNGIEGHLWIGGKGVANGYISDVKLTQEKFCVLDNERWYFTGDRGKYDESNRVIFLGRIDDQEKINGYRIELGELEAQLAELVKEKAYAWVERKNDRAQLKAAYKLLGESPIFYKKKANEKQRWSGQNEAVANSIYEFLKTLIRDERIKGDTPIAAAWKCWLESFDSADVLDKAFMQMLNERREEFIGTAIGELSPYWLLNDNYFSITSLYKRDAATQSAIKELCEILKRELKPDCKVALMKPDSHFVQSFAERINLEETETVCWFDNVYEYNLVKKTCGDYKIRFELVKDYIIMENEEFSYDFVVANNAMHQFKNPETGLRMAYAFLKDKGKLYAIEQEHLPAVGLISSVVLENGFEHYMGRSERYSPMLTANEWSFYLSAAGFINIINGRTNNEENTILLEAAANHKNKLYTEEELKANLRTKLPAYMIPEKIAVLYDEPLSSNGKVDKKKLKGISYERHHPLEAPFTEVEKEVAGFWKELLGEEEIGRESAFFEMGGDSLMATRFLGKIRQVYDVSISLREMLENSRLSEVSHLIEQRSSIEELEEGEL